MKIYQIMLLTVASLAMICCKDPNNNPVIDDDDWDSITPLVDVHDGSIDEWSSLPSDYVVDLVCPENAYWKGLKNVKVYADPLYINLLVEMEPSLIVDRGLDASGDPVSFHIYLNADANNRTGGYNVEFSDANAEWNLEGFFFERGEANGFNPAVFQWWGAMGGGITDQSDTNGWYWTDPTKSHDQSDGYGAIIPSNSLAIGASQYLEGKYFEIQINRAMTKIEFQREFGIGFDIQQHWTSVGVLPGHDVDPITGDKILAKKATVKIDYENYDL